MFLIQFRFLDSFNGERVAPQIVTIQHDGIGFLSSGVKIAVIVVCIW